MRKIQLFNIHSCEGDEWVDITFKDVKKGDTVRIFENDWETPIVGKNGGTIFIATSNAYKSEMGIYIFNYEEQKNATV